MNSYAELEALFTNLNHLEHLQAIAGWDEAVMMPVGGGPARAKALAALQTLSHQMLIDKKVKGLIESSKALPLDKWQSANLALIEKKYQNATCLPTDLVEKLANTTMQTEQAWRQYRAENNWKDFAPLLDENIKLIKQSADIRAQKFNKNPYDILLDDFSPDINQQVIEPIFNTLKQKLPNIVQKVIERQSKQHTIALQGPFTIDSQKQLGLDLMQALGFDFNHGRLDTSHHPFCGGVPEDVGYVLRSPASLPVRMRARS